MKAAWTAGLTLNQAAEFKKRVEAAKDVLSRLTQLASVELDAIERKGLREDDYQSMDWTHVQAFRNGKIAQLRWLQDLLN